MRGYRAAVGLVDDALDKWQRQVAEVVERALDRGIGEGRRYEGIEFGDGGGVRLELIFVARPFETALETSKLVAQGGGLGGGEVVLADLVDGFFDVCRGIIAVAF